MKLCQYHWNKLIEAIQADGLGDLIPQGPLELVRRIHSRKADGINQTNFDPISMANDLITIWSVSSIGRDDLMSAASQCPICFFDVPQWIEKASNDSGEAWRKICSF